MLYILSISLQFCGALFLGLSSIGLSDKKLFTGRDGLMIIGQQPYMLVEQVKRLKNNQLHASFGIVYVFTGLLLSCFSSDMKFILYLTHYLALSIIITSLTLLIISFILNKKYGKYRKYYPVANHYIKDGEMALSIEEPELTKYSEDFK